MRKNLTISVLYTAVTGIVLGLFYPLMMTGLAQALFHDKANGELVVKNGVILGSQIIGQSFTGSGYFHSRLSAAGMNGYDPTASGGSNYGPTNKRYVDRVQSDVAAWQKENPSDPVPVDLVTTSGSGLDPDITPASAFYQVSRIAAARHISEENVRALVQSHIQERQFGVLGEPRVNVLELNLALDGVSNTH